jgi:hypothetical protein
MDLRHARSPGEAVVTNRRVSGWLAALWMFSGLFALYAGWQLENVWAFALGAFLIGVSFTLIRSSLKG